jgi:hypothetical protein
MDIEKFIENVSEAVKGYDWIKRLEVHRRTEIRVWLRLFLNGEFIETFHNFLKKLEEELNKNLSFKKKALPKKFVFLSKRKLYQRNLFFF